MGKAGITNDDMKTAIQYAKDVQAFVLQVLQEEGCAPSGHETRGRI